MDLLPLKKLDAILKILVDNSDLHSKVFLVVIVAEMCKVGLETSHKDIRIMVNKLVKDGYCEFHENSRLAISPPLRDEYLITFEGLIFYNKGGYVRAFEQENQKFKTEKIHNRMLVWGTVAAGAYGIFEILHWSIDYVQNYMCHCRFLWEK